LFLAIAFPRLSLAILITRILYSYKTHLASASIKIHWIFTLRNIFPPVISKKFTNFVNYICLFGDWIKYTYMDCSNTSIFATRDNFESVCIAKLHLRGMQWNLVINGACLFMNYIVTLIFKPWKIITPYVTKQTNLKAKSPLDNPP
jgi:hypothetical protein